MQILIIYFLNSILKIIFIFFIKKISIFTYNLNMYKNFLLNFKTI